MGGLLLAQAGKADPVTARVYAIFCNRLYEYASDDGITRQGWMWPVDDVAVVNQGVG